MRQWIDLFEHSETNLFYHGTSSVFLDEIEKNGLSAKTDNAVYQGDLSALGGVYLTIGQDWARSYADNACKAVGGTPVVVVIEGRWEAMLMDEDEILMSIESAADDYDDADELATVIMKSYGMPGSATADVTALAGLVLDGAEKAKLRPLLKRLAQTVPAQPVDAFDEPHYQVHHMGNIGFSGSPRIVKIER